MAETLGSLCDKLTIVKLKQFHTDDSERLASLGTQESQLREEIDAFLADAMAGAIRPERLTFRANKVFKAQGNAVAAVAGTIGAVFAQLAQVNCQLWHEQEKVYDFARVPADQKDAVVKQLALLNLERTQCIDAIDAALVRMVTERP
jgi:hypothetical protein